LSQCSIERERRKGGAGEEELQGKEEQ